MNQRMAYQEFSQEGTFFIGCNYWASHAGTAMWSRWDAEIVEKDFQRLARDRVTTLRIFPLWPDFQPIHLLRAETGIPREYRFAEEPLPMDSVGQAGVSAEMLERFGELCALADKYSLQLVVGLLTGWMSGRLFVPPALEGLNVLTDPVALMWETRLVRCLVERFKNEPAITAWDLGNECNCMGTVETAEQFYLWTAAITGAIRSCDPERPIVSGMHSLLPDSSHSIQHQGELTDYLTTHPYPSFTPYCEADPLDTIRPQLHATAETLFYRGIGQKPCFVEEIGTLGNMMVAEDVAAGYARTNLYSLWAHDCRGFLWWCAHEQSHLTHAPYDWNQVELELGLYRSDGSAKPVLREMTAFSEFLDLLPVSMLPPRLVDGICVLSRQQDSWGAAYSSFVLAKQAGLELEFRYSDQELPDAPLYLLPCLNGMSPFTNRWWNGLLRRVREGADLYLSLDSALIGGFEELTGLRVLTRSRAEGQEMILDFGRPDMAPLPVWSSFRFKLQTTTARVLATGVNGNPIFTVNQYGQGRVYVVTCPLETSLSEKPDIFDGPHDYASVYRCLREKPASRHIASIENQDIGITEHVLDESTRLLVLVNYAPLPAAVMLTLASGWSVDRALRGGLELDANDAAVLIIKRG